MYPLYGSYGTDNANEFASRLWSAISILLILLLLGVCVFLFREVCELACDCQIHCRHVWGRENEVDEQKKTAISVPVRRFSIIAKPRTSN